jgi:hypothetical protein
VPPQGDEQNAKSLQKNTFSRAGGSTGGSIKNNPEIQEIFLIWAKLDDPARCDLLAFARGLAEVAP